LLILSSCSKDDNGSGYDHFVSSEPVISYSRDQMRLVIDFVSQSIPDLSQMKPFIDSDVDIYKIVYKTVINGDEINASGVICLPSDPGTYPILSFQNGTNTLFSNAPSKSATGITYQLIEIVASMGYIVVISDYPGFGESEGIVHPYLVKEPTVTQALDLFSAASEFTESGGQEGVSAGSDVYLIGYSQGGWATLAIHKALELDFDAEFSLKGSVCGAGPYNISQLFTQMTGGGTYSYPAYLAYIVNAYKAYGQFTNPVTDIFREQYASRIPGFFNGLQSTDQINSQLTTSISSLLTPEFIAGYATEAKYATVRSAMENNSITPWKTFKPLLLVHGDSDTQVNVSSTENIYSGLISAGTSTAVCRKLIIPGADHGDGLVPSMIQGILFLNGIKDPGLTYHNRAF
jgi:pimeloyl-ACP methyl ester carboxylesterase